MSVSRVPSEVSAAERARWLAELAEAIEQAQRLVWTLGMAHGRSAEALDLYARLESARAEVQALRLSRTRERRHSFDPNWSEKLPWDQAQSEPRS